MICSRLSFAQAPVVEEGVSAPLDVRVGLDGGELGAVGLDDVGPGALEVPVGSEVDHVPEVGAVGEALGAGFGLVPQAASSPTVPTASSPLRLSP